MAFPVIQLKDVTRVYSPGLNQVMALRGVDLTINEGEMVAIMGTSGSGKSTLMHILGCLDRPSSGRYLFASQDVTGMTPDQLAGVRNRKIGFIFQGFNLLSRVPAWENVCLPMVYAGISRTVMIRKALAMLARVGLAGREEHRPNQLSGGQQQRVAIARALVNEPSIILADEPTGALDTRTSIEIMSLLQQLHQEKDLTIVIVTHDPEIAAYCRRLVRLRDGRIVEDRPVEKPRQAALELAALPQEEGNLN